MTNSSKENSNWSNEVLKGLQKQLEDEITHELGISLTPEDSAHIKAEFDREIGGKFTTRIKELKEELKDEFIRTRKQDTRDALSTGEIFYRFGRNIRAQHFILAVSMVLLILSGLPVRFHDVVIFKFLMFLFGGIDNSTFLHRVGAVGLMIVAVWHVCWLILTKDGRKDFIALLPVPKDVLDVIQNMKYFLRLSNDKARFDRFSYIEKFDYWAVYWGVVVMVGSGLLLWFQDITLRYLPKFILDIAKEMHRDEALLATLAIVIWHMYNAHLNPHKFPGTLVIWNGLITKEEMEDEHPVEYEKRLRAEEGRRGDS
jgi:cytochrome b subunit of formate dehydrogenase